MYNAFISIVHVLEPDDPVAAQLGSVLARLAETCAASFKDYEIVLVENRFYPNLPQAVTRIPDNEKQHISLIKLASEVEEGSAVMAGLDRANGDYVAVLSACVLARPEVVKHLYEKTQKGNDIVYLQSSQRRLPFLQRIFHSAFYGLLNRFSSVRLDPRMRFDRILSRRALGWVLRMREQTRFSKALFTSIGFSSCPFEIDFPYRERSVSFPALFRQGFNVLATHTTLLLRMLEIGIVLSTLFIMAVIANALAVHVSGHDLFMEPQARVPGWTFLIVFLSIMWIYLNGVLYVLASFVQNIYHEVRARPLYIIESIRKV